MIFDKFVNNRLLEKLSSFNKTVIWIITPAVKFNQNVIIKHYWSLTMMTIIRDK